MDAHKKLAVEIYLDQVKILTALATTLLLTPNVLLGFSEQEDLRTSLQTNLPHWRTLLLGTNVCFVLVVLLTYFVYSSVVGSIHSGNPDVNRPFTRGFSLAQFVLMILGLSGLVILFKNML